MPATTKERDAELDSFAVSEIVCRKGEGGLCRNDVAVERFGSVKMGELREVLCEGLLVLEKEILAQGAGDGLGTSLC